MLFYSISLGKFNKVLWLRTTRDQCTTMLARGNMKHISLPLHLFQNEGASGKLLKHMESPLRLGIKTAMLKLTPCVNIYIVTDARTTHQFCLGKSREQADTEARPFLHGLS